MDVSFDPFVHKLCLELADFINNTGDDKTVKYQESELDIIVYLQRGKIMQTESFSCVPKSINHQLYIYPDTDDLKLRIQKAFIFAFNKENNTNTLIFNNTNFDVHFLKTFEQLLMYSDFKKNRSLSVGQFPKRSQCILI